MPARPSFLKIGNHYVHWQSLQYKYMKNKLPVEIVDTIEMDDKQLKVVFKKTDPSDPPVLF